MSYQVLARKWRPKTFAELIGQNHVKNTLINTLNMGRLHHAYLFTGTRGVGKTTIARIFAKSLNCQVGVSAEPCGTCDVCTSIEQGQFVDLIEIDAASRTKVEDTREILDNVMYAPTRGRYKVYLIDEVHMLSRHSFNALLKTLEEPPEHVKFLLATTEAQKLPITILSRCLQFNLTAIARNEIAEHLAHILTAEQIEFEQTALPLLAKAAEGSLRDGLSLTDQAIAQANGPLKADDVRQMLGSIDKKWTLQLLAHIVNQDAEKALATVDDIAKFTPNFRQLIDELLSLFHLAAMAQLVPNVAKVDENVQAYVKRLAQKLPAAQIQVYYQILLSGKKDMAFAPDARMGFEMLMLRLLAFKPLPSAERPAQDDPMPIIESLKKNTEIQPQPEPELKPSNEYNPEPDLQLTQVPDKSIEQLAKEQNSLMFAAEQQGFKPITETDEASNGTIDNKEPKLETKTVSTPTPIVAPNPVIEVKPQPEPEPQLKTQSTSEAVNDMPLDISFSADEDDEEGGYSYGYGDDYSYEQLSEHQLSDQQLPGEPSGSNGRTSTQLPIQQTTPKSGLSALMSQTTSDTGFAVDVDNPTPKFDDDTQDPMFAILANRNIAVDEVVAAKQARVKAQVPELVVVPKVGVTPKLEAAPKLEAVAKEKVETKVDSITEAAQEEKAAAKVEEKRPAPVEEKPETIQEPIPQVAVEDQLEAPAARQIEDYQPQQSPQPEQSPQPVPQEQQVLANDRPRWAREIDDWANLIEQMGIGGLVRIFAVKGIYTKQDKQVTLTVDATEQHLDSQGLRDQIEKSLTLTLNEVIELDIEYTNEHLNSPFNIQRQIEADRLAYAQAQIHGDNIVNALQQRFDAIVDEQSIQAVG